MKIINKTAWETNDLRRVFGAVLANWNKGKGPSRQVRSKRLNHVEVNYAKACNWWGFSGCAYYNSGWMNLRLPRPKGHGWKERVREVIWEDNPDGSRTWSQGEGYKTIERGHKVETLDVLKLAHLFEHELAHCAGYSHKQMGSLNDWDAATKERYPYLDGMTVRIKEKKPKPPKDRRAAAYEAAKAGLARWQTKLKRAETGVKKYRKKVRYYEKALAPLLPVELVAVGEDISEAPFPGGLEEGLATEREVDLSPNPQAQPASG